jgi:hypothetical protein
MMGTGDGRKDDKGRLNHGGYWLDCFKHAVRQELELLELECQLVP